MGAPKRARSLYTDKNFGSNVWFSRVYSLKNWVVVTQISKNWVTVTQIFKEWTRLTQKIDAKILTV